MPIQSKITSVLSPYIGEKGNAQFKKIGLKKSDLALLSFNDSSYVVPVMPEPTMCFRGLEIKINDEDIADKSTKSKVKLNNNQYLDISLWLSFVSFNNECESSDVYVMIYKEGQPCPIIISKTTAEEYDDTDIDLETDKCLWSEGRYFMLLGNVEYSDDDDEYDKLQKVGNYLLMPFEVVPKLHDMKGDVTGVAVNAELLFENGRILEVKLTLDRELEDKNDCKIVCYNNKLNYMGSNTPVVNDNVLEFVICSNHLWTAGEYTAVVMKNDRLVAGVRFDVNAEGCCVNTRLSSKDDTLDLLLAGADNDESWNAVSKIAGYDALRLYVLQTTRMLRVNQARAEAGCAKFVPTHVMACVGQYTPELEKMVNAVSKLLNEDTVRVVDASEIVASGAEDGNYKNSPFVLSCSFDGDSYKEVLIHNLSYLTSSEALFSMNMLRQRLEQNKIRFLALVGSKEEIEALKSMYDFIAISLRDENIVDVSKIDPQSALFEVEELMSNVSLSLTDEARDKIWTGFEQAQAADMFVSWTNADSVLLMQSIVSRMAHRLSLCNDLTGNDVMLLSNVLPQDVVMPDLGSNLKTETYEQCVAQLNSMIGLEEVKKTMLQAANMARFNMLRRNAGLDGKFKGCHHMVFTGNPGTGKTTVAKFVGRIYRSLGLLSKGDVIVTERGKLVGRYIGETEKNVRQVLNEARGNVLFVDEAYTLFTGEGDTNDFGRRVIEGLLTVLSQENPDMIVIFAGYKADMDRMFQANQGLCGRFPIELEFADYDADQLCEIAKRLIKKEGFVLDAEAAEALSQEIAKAYDNRGKYFSNARWAEQFVRNGVIVAMASRVMADGTPDIEALKNITKTDVEAAAVKMSKSSTIKECRRVGF